MTATEPRLLAIPGPAGQLSADLQLPSDPIGLVLFAHGSGSSRFSSRNRHVALALQQAGLGTVLPDLPDQGASATAALLALLDWTRAQPPLAQLPLGLFGASRGAASALEAAAARPSCVRAVVSRGGRPDLAFEALAAVRCPTLLIVGSQDLDVLELNAWAASFLRASHDLAVVPGASHLFSEPGTLDAAAALAREWFVRHLTAA